MNALFHSLQFTMPIDKFSDEHLEQARVVGLDHPAFGGGIEVFPDVIAGDQRTRIRDVLVRELEVAGNDNGSRPSISYGIRIERTCSGSELRHMREMQALFRWMCESTGLSKDCRQMNAMIINQYTPGCGIPPHRDGKYTRGNETLALTAQGRATLELIIDGAGDGLLKTGFEASAGSAYRLHGPAFTKAHHWISRREPEQNEDPRLSIAFLVDCQPATV